MSKKFDILTSLDVCVDLILTGDVRPEFGQKEKLVNDYFFEMGGSNCIFACQAAKLGLRVSGVGIAGNDVFGEYVKSSLQKSGVDISHLKTDSSCKTAIGVALYENGDRAILTYLGTIAVTGLETVLDALLLDARHLHIGSYYLMDGLRPHWRKIAERAKELGITVSLDTNWDPEETWERGLSELLPYVDVIFPNENEAKHITGKTCEESAAKALLEHVKVAVIKNGEGGAKVFLRDGAIFSSPSFSVDVVDTVGAGDSFAAGFLLGYINGAPPEICLKNAIICGSMSTGGSGGISSQVTFDEMQGFLKSFDDIINKKRGDQYAQKTNN